MFQVMLETRRDRERASMGFWLCLFMILVFIELLLGTCILIMVLRI